MLCTQSLLLHFAACTPYWDLSSDQGVYYRPTDHFPFPLLISAVLPIYKQNKTFTVGEVRDAGGGQNPSLPSYSRNAQNYRDLMCLGFLDGLIFRYSNGKIAYLGLWVSF